MEYFMERKARKLIAQGRVGKIYFDGEFVYKTFPQDYDLSWILYEVNVQNEIAKNTNLPVLTYELLEQNREIKMPYIPGVELTQRIQKENYKHGLEDFIALQTSVFEYQGLHLHNAHDEFVLRINQSSLDDQIKSKALASLALIERKNQLCHFDMHFSNIMFDGSKYYIIDWVNAKLGNPILDITRSYVILRQYVKRWANKYLRMICKEMNLKKEDCMKAIPIIAALRILESEDMGFIDELKEMVLRESVE